MSSIRWNFIVVLWFKVTMGEKIITEDGRVHISEEDQNKTVKDEHIRCLQSIVYDPYPAGLYCNRTWDNIACWPDTPPGSISYQSCPTYIQGFYILGNATKKCMPDGQWYYNTDTNTTWTNYSQCLRNRQPPTQVSNLIMVHIEYIQFMYNTGYGISVLSLVLAVTIMLRFRKLHCPRNTVHINLFISFILRAVLSFLKDLLFVQGLGFSSDVEWTSTDTVLFIEDGTHWECKLLYTLFNYVLSANYMWILVEGLYLHTLVYVSVFSERGSVKWYYLLGWGTPFLSVIPWVLVRLSLENENVLCWNTNPSQGFLWILKGPIVLSILINFIFFINILRALFTKLHKPSTSSARRNRYRRLAKATLILIPLCGVHYIVFIGVPENLNPTAEVIKLYFEMFFNSFQGFLVAVLLCFFNQEVQMEIRKKWYKLISKPDPLYIQQAQFLVNSHDGGARRLREPRLNLPSDKFMSSEGSSGIVDGCLCKWSLDKNGRLRCSFVKTVPLKTPKNKKNLLTKESRM